MLKKRMANATETAEFARLDNLVKGETLHLNKYGKGKYLLPAKRETSIIVSRVLATVDGSGNDFCAIVKNNDTFYEKTFNSLYFSREVAAPLTEVNTLW